MLLLARYLKRSRAIRCAKCRLSSTPEACSCRLAITSRLRHPRDNTQPTPITSGHTAARPHPPSGSLTDGCCLPLDGYAQLHDRARLNALDRRPASAEGAAAPPTHNTTTDRRQPEAQPRYRRRHAFKAQPTSAYPRTGLRVRSIQQRVAESSRAPLTSERHTIIRYGSTQVEGGCWGGDLCSHLRCRAVVRSEGAGRRSGP